MADRPGLFVGICELPFALHRDSGNGFRSSGDFNGSSAGYAAALTSCANPSLLHDTRPANMRDPADIKAIDPS